MRAVKRRQRRAPDAPAHPAPGPGTGLARRPHTDPVPAQVPGRAPIPEATIQPVPAGPPAGRHAAVPPPARGASRRHGPVTFLMLGFVLLIALGAGAWRLTGGQLRVMETASMCPKICVGSLIADKPLTGPLHVGELITFYPPGDLTSTYSHEVWHIYPSGVIETKGVANPRHDPWLITRQDIVGEVAFHVAGAGWLLKALPLLGVGVLCWVLARPFISPAIRRGWDRAWLALLLIVPELLLHPLLGGTVTNSTGTRTLHETLVNTGLLPEDFHAGSQTVAHHVLPGHIAHVVVHAPPDRVPLLRQSASLPWWGWALVGLAVSWPLLGFLWHYLRGDEAPAPAAPARRPRSQPAISA